MLLSDSPRGRAISTKTDANSSIEDERNKPYFAMVSVLQFGLLRRPRPPVPPQGYWFQVKETHVNKKKNCSVHKIGGTRKAQRTAESKLTRLIPISLDACSLAILDSECVQM